MRRYELTDLPARLRDRIVIDRDSGCWVVQNSRPRSDPPSEYRGISYGGQLGQTHVLAYTLLVGPIPAGLALDHVWDRGCRSKACCFPGHLEPVTYEENSRRRVAARWSDVRPGSEVAQRRSGLDQSA